MNIMKFLESLANQGAVESLNNKGSRRDTFSQLGKMGATAAVAAVPFSMLFSQRAAAATAAAAAVAETPLDSLKLALTLEYLEDEFYKIALQRNFLTPEQEIIVEQISKHEAAHVALLKGAIPAPVPAKPTFDFEGPFPDVFSNPVTFFAVAQALEDTGVRAYKGQAGNFPNAADKATLTIALQIHSVEARHASRIRRYRGLKGWISGNERGAGMPEATQAVYNGEDLANQAGFNTASVAAGSGNRTIPAIAGSESFDEPITTAQAVAIASLFIVS